MTTPTTGPGEPTSADAGVSNTVAEEAILRKVTEMTAADPALGGRLSALARSPLAAHSVRSVPSAGLGALRSAPAAARSPRIAAAKGRSRVEMLRSEAEGRAVGVGISPADLAGYLGGHVLSPEGRVKLAKPDDDLVLARGVNERQLPLCLTHPSDAETTAPSDKEAMAQVGEHVFGELVEFTTNAAIAVQFSTRSAAEKKYVIVVRIKRRYLTKGSGSEGGWICRKEAPYEVLNTAEGRLLA